MKCAGVGYSNNGEGEKESCSTCNDYCLCPFGSGDSGWKDNDPSDDICQKEVSQSKKEIKKKDYRTKMYIHQKMMEERRRIDAELDRKIREE